MQILAPPPNPPPVALADGDGLHRVFFRLRLLGLTAITVLVTAWFCMLGVVPAILALVTAKHVLVAILVMGLGVDAKDQPEG
jgi:hypothetical protein